MDRNSKIILVTSSNKNICTDNNKYVLDKTMIFMTRRVSYYNRPKYACARHRRRYTRPCIILRITACRREMIVVPRTDVKFDERVHNIVHDIKRREWIIIGIY